MEPNKTNYTATLQELMVVNSTCSRATLKRRILQAGLLPELCAVCGDPPVWKGKPLVLRLDHINGNRTDGRFENLRLVCPNCDSQLPTFAGRNKIGTKHKPKVDNLCALCAKIIGKHSTYCVQCTQKAIPQPTKIGWPDIQTLRDMKKTLSWSEMEGALHITASAIQQRMRRRK